MNRLDPLVGVERSLAGVTQAIHQCVAEQHPPVVGAMHITCADEAENECVRAFQNGFVRYFVPALKFAEHSAFRLANLGGRYEWGAVRIAEQHYATGKSQESHKLLAIKVNAHVGFTDGAEGPHFGMLTRYQSESACCGALYQLLDGGNEPHLRELRRIFTSEARDRIAVLQDAEHIDAAHRSLLAAVVSARLQARKIVLDIQDYEPASPTRYLVLPSVTINRPGRDAEILCGYYWGTDPNQPASLEYFGLGDDPAEYRIEYTHDRIVVSDDNLGTRREARSHRIMILEEWRKQANISRSEVRDERLDRFVRAVDDDQHRGADRAKVILHELLPIVGQVMPISAAVLLFAHGLAGIHHAFRMHRVVRRMEGSDQARYVLNEIHERLDRLDSEDAEAMVELLVRHYRA